MSNDKTISFEEHLKTQQQQKTLESYHRERAKLQENLVGSSERFLAAWKIRNFFFQLKNIYSNCCHDRKKG